MTQLERDRKLVADYEAIHGKPESSAEVRALPVEVQHARRSIHIATVRRTQSREMAGLPNERKILTKTPKSPHDRLQSLLEL